MLIIYTWQCNNSSATSQLGVTPPGWQSNKFSQKIFCFSKVGMFSYYLAPKRTKAINQSIGSMFSLSKEPFQITSATFQNESMPPHWSSASGMGLLLVPSDPLEVQLVERVVAGAPLQLELRPPASTPRCTFCTPFHFFQTSWPPWSNLVLLNWWWL